MACIKGRGVPGAGRGPPKAFRAAGAGPPGRHPPTRRNGLQWPPEQRRSVCFPTEYQRGTAAASLSAEACGCGLGGGVLRVSFTSATEPRAVAAPAAGFLREGVARRYLGRFDNLRRAGAGSGGAACASVSPAPQSPGRCPLPPPAS